MSNFSKTVEIANSNGLHARPAGKIVAIASEFSCDIRINLDDNEADARSIIELMTLTAICGATVQVSATGEDAEKAVNSIVQLIEERFLEE